MAYNRFRLRVMWRAMLLCATALALAWVVFEEHWYISAIFLALAFVAQAVSLIGFVEKTNRDLARFLASVKHHDFTLRFASESGNPSFRELNRLFNDVLQTFTRIKTDKEVDHQYLQAIIRHIGTGIISFDNRGEVRLINKGAKDLLHLPHLKNIQVLRRLNPDLEEAIFTLANGEKKVVSVELNGQPLLLMLQCMVLQLQGEELKIVSVQNIRSEMEEQELEAWQKLIRVLTHETMISVTPIISLAATLNSLLPQQTPVGGPAEMLDEDTLLDLRTGLQTIERRSTGMLHFVESFRKLTRVRKPDPEPVPLKQLLDRVCQLMKPTISEAGLELRVSISPPDLTLFVDPDLIEQVLINLIKNATEAASGISGGFIEVSAYPDEAAHNRPRIDVKDNGPGIPSEILDKIFIPFYTTKKQGSGIGLALSRQIMRQHGGALRLRTEPGNTVFSLVF